MSGIDTICALSSAAGRAGVAVVRVSGPGAGPALEALCRALPDPRCAALRTIRRPGTGEAIDRGIILWFPGPASFTGEDVAEVHLHGGRAVVAAVLEALCGLGCRLAEPGEFARRAFENGKIDLTEAEGLADLIDAETEAQRRQAVRQAGGALHKLYEGWRANLISALALTEAAIDFSDEADVADDALENARAIVVALVSTLRAHLADGRRGEILRDGFQVVLAGPPNVGKSSLLNALARREAAIVSPEAGTTRDVIEVRLDLDGWPVIVRDTAGVREAAGEVEREGIRRTLAHGRAADLVVWLMDARAPVWALPDQLRDREAATLWVMNKVDLIAAAGAGGVMMAAPASTRAWLAVSAATREGLADLVAHIAGRARERLDPGEAPALTQARHRVALEACLACLEDALGKPLVEAELRAEDLRCAGQALGRITGRIDAELVLDQVFARFCIGK